MSNERKQFSPLHSYCVGCKKVRVAKKDGPYATGTKTPIYKKGDFIVPCNGIPKDLNYIPSFENIQHKLEDHEIEYTKALYDPVLWAKIHLDWEPRASREGEEYQALPLRCTSKRKVLRFGRRSGKTDVLCIAILHYLFTNSPTVKRWDKQQKKFVDGFSTILVLAPYLSQIKLIFDRLSKLIGNNAALSNEVKRQIASPYHTLELYNGAKVVGFPSGAKSGTGAESVRGQKADLIILDEMDYLRDEDMETIIALLMEHSDVSLWGSSTPSGKREHFYRFCMERMDFKEFHYAAMVNPSWGPELELELREFYQTQLAWEHEILAEFGESVTGVFQAGFVDKAVEEYKYENESRNRDWLYSIGVDWNDAANGTKLMVIGLNPDTGRFKVVHKESVEKVQWTQTTAITTLIRLNRTWKPDFIYVDEGYGQTQIEVLKKTGMEAELKGDKVDAKLKEIKGINLSSKLEIYDPLTQLPTKEWIKPFMVNNAVRRFEQEQVSISQYDEILYKQLLGYSIAKVSQTGMPVYESGPDGDHDLDAFMLALLGFTMELSDFTHVKYHGAVAIAGKFGEKTIATESLMAKIENRNPDFTSASTRNRDTKPLNPESRSSDIEYLPLTGVPTISTIPGVNTRIYSHEAFNSDRPGAGLKNRKRPFVRIKPVRKSF